MARLTEVTYQEQAEIDTSSAQIRRVKILGRESKNGRSYSANALAQAARLYDGCRVHVNHDRSGSGRRIEEYFGSLRDIRVDADGVYGTLEYLKTHPHAGQIIETAERFPKHLGLSHDAEGDYGRDRSPDGNPIVETITAVNSVDLVGRPATSKSLFEDKHMTKTIKAIIESERKDASGVAILRRLVEQDPALAEMPIQLPAETEGADAIREAFKAAVMAAIDDKSLDLSATVQKIKKLLKALEDVSGEPVGGVSEPELAMVGEEFKRMKTELRAITEERDRIALESRVRKLIESRGKVADDRKLAAICSMHSDEYREAMIDILPDRNSGISHLQPGVLRESVAAMPKTAKEFADLCRM